MPWVYDSKSVFKDTHRHDLPDANSARPGDVFQCDGCKEFFLCRPPGDYYSNYWWPVMPWSFSAKRKIKKWKEAQ